MPAQSAHHLYSDGSENRRRQSVRPHVLVIEESPAIQDMLSKVLDLAGYQVSSISNEQTALTWIDNALMSQYPPALILVDLGSTPLQGETLLIKLRERWRSASFLRPPIIGLTTMQMHSSALTSLTYSVIRKPFHLHELITQIQEALAHH